MSTWRTGEIEVELPNERNPPYTILPGTQVPLTLKVTPHPTDGVNRSVWFTDDDGNTDQPRHGYFGVGAATYVAQLEADPQTLYFKSGDQHYFLAMNTSNAPLVISRAEFTGLSGSSFRLVDPTQFPVTVQPHTHRRLYIQYSLPATSSVFHAFGPPQSTLKLYSNGGNKSVELIGSQDSPKIKTFEVPVIDPRIRSSRPWWRSLQR